MTSMLHVKFDSSIRPPEYGSDVLDEADTGGVQIIGRNSPFIGYFVTKTKKNTEKIPEDSRLTQALSDSILFVSKLKV